MTDRLTPDPSCADATDPSSLSFSTALKRIVDTIRPVSDCECLPLRDALNRILARDVVSPLNVPGHTNAAMDGYALSGDRLPEEGTLDLRVIGSAHAGRPFDKPIAPDECVRIMTGAPVPVGTDTVVMQEQVLDLGSGHVRICGGQSPGQNIRREGEDITRGSVVLNAGRLITPADLGIVASLGIAELWIRRKPRVAFFSTGDELRSVDQPLAPGEVYDSNSHTLYGMLRRLGVDVLDMGVVGDNPEALEKAFASAAGAADAVITSGGVSVGDADHTKAILAEAGAMEFWKLAVKPGRPFAFGRIDDTLFFGLPGNPVAVMVTFYQLVQPGLERLAGHTAPRTFTVSAICRDRVRKRPGRTEFIRGILSHDADGTLSVRRTGPQGSGVLTSMSHANCFVILPDDSSTIEPGNPVTVQPFAGLI